jgi:predicted metal-binding membrane protein
MANGPLWPLPAISAAGWAALAAMAATPAFARICGRLGRWEALALDWRLTDPAPLLGFFLAMLGAMMAPLLAQNLTWVRAQSLSARRRRATGLFLTGYLLPWVLAMGGLWAVMGLLVLATRHDLAALGLAAGLCLLWQGTPAKAAALRRCHRIPALPAFGLRAEWASLAYGLESAAWCIAACWALMLAAFAHTPAHLWLMAGAFGVALSERYSRAPAIRARPILLLAGAAVIALTLALDQLPPP